MLPGGISRNKKIFTLLGGSYFVGVNVMVDPVTVSTKDRDVGREIMVHDPSPKLFISKILELSKHKTIAIDVMEVQAYCFSGSTGLALVSIAPECIRF